MVKATCPVRGALGGIPLPQGSTDAVLRLHYDEGLANHIGPEPCVGLREEADEKSVGERVGGVSRRESG